jgi:hypothetical protein
MMDNGTVTKDDLIEIACRFSQELREFCDAAVDCGDSLPGTELLLKEWDDAYEKFNRPSVAPFNTIERGIDKFELESMNKGKFLR